MKATIYNIVLIKANVLFIYHQMSPNVEQKETMKTKNIKYHYIFVYIHKSTIIIEFVIMKDFDNIKEQTVRLNKIKRNKMFDVK